MNTKKLVLDLDLPEFSKTLRFVMDSLTGDFGVQELERQVQESSKIIPLLTKILAAAGEAQCRIDSIRDTPYQDDPELMGQFFKHIEFFSCLQGSLATLLAVSKILQQQNDSQPQARKRKKS